MKYANIIPLIGGMSLANEQATGKIPSYILSYPDFEANEKGLLNWYESKGVEVPYFF